MSVVVGAVAVIAYVACGVITLRVINHFDSDPDDEGGPMIDGLVIVAWPIAAVVGGPFLLAWAVGSIYRRLVGEGTTDGE